jgi:hypothetical protein
MPGMSRGETSVEPGLNGGKFRLGTRCFCGLEREKAGFDGAARPGRVPGDPAQVFAVKTVTQQQNAPEPIRGRFSEGVD